MLPYVHKTVTATIAGTRVMEVHCEKCGRQFFYELARLGVGGAVAPYMLGQQGARDRAQSRAQRSLQNRLHSDHELVPCPHCRWVNESAVRQFRKSKHREWVWLAVVVLVFGTLTCLTLYMAADDFFGHPSSLAAPEFWLAAIGTVAAVASVLMIQHFLRIRINPNRQTVNGLPRVPIGTPPALILDATGQTLVRAPGDITVPPKEPDWALFRPGQLEWEPLCCQCLVASTDTFSLPYVLHPVEPVPLCRRCLRRLRRQFWVLNVGALLVFLPAGFAIALMTGRVTGVGLAVASIVIAAFPIFIAFTITEHSLPPYRLRVVDHDRGIMKISFRNPAYTAILIRKIGHIDGIF